VASPYYEIRVAGTLGPELLVDFDRLASCVEPQATVLHGPLPDQAALYGLLARLELVGAQVLEVRRLRDEGPPVTGDAGLRHGRRPGQAGGLGPSPAG
jgi:hypothetical protein